MKCVYTNIFLLVKVCVYTYMCIYIRHRAGACGGREACTGYAQAWLLHPPSSVSSILHPPSSILHPLSSILHPPGSRSRSWSWEFESGGWSLELAAPSWRIPLREVQGGPLRPAAWIPTPQEELLESGACSPILEDSSSS